MLTKKTIKERKRNKIIQKKRLRKLATIKKRRK